MDHVRCQRWYASVAIVVECRCADSVWFKFGKESITFGKLLEIFGERFITVFKLISQVPSTMGDDVVPPDWWPEQGPEGHHFMLLKLRH